MRRIALAALALAAASCSSTRDLGPFDIRLALDPAAGCDRGCGGYPMSCGGVMLYRIVDLEAGPGGEELERRCVDVDANPDDVCGLGELADNFRGLPAHRIRLEVAVWRPNLIPRAGPRPVCPDSSELFTLDGGVRVDFSPQPAFGGAAVFDVGSDASEAVVPLACSDPGQLDVAACDGETTTIAALVTDLETSLNLTVEQATTLEVSAVEPTSLGGLGWELDPEPGSATALDLQLGANPTFQAIFRDALPGRLCAVVFEPVPQSTAAVSCRTVPADATGGELNLEGLLVAKPTLDAALGALGLAAFPAAGLVLGRVVDHTGAALAGVAVSPAAGSVRYLAADRTSLIPLGDAQVTSSSGFFVSTAVPFDTAFTALHLGDGRRETGAPIGGLVRNELTALLIEMQAP